MLALASRCCLALGLLAVASAAGLAVVAFYPASFYVVLGLLFWGLARRRAKLSAFGTAAWASFRHLWRAGMIDATRGIILGRPVGAAVPSRLDSIREVFLAPAGKSDFACRLFLSGRRSKRNQLIRLPNAVHTAIFAPTGAGKGVSIAIPELLTNPNSMVVADLKNGENARITAAFRTKRFGHRCVLLDPFRVVTRGPDSLNPLDFISVDDPQSLDACRDLAAALVVRTGQEKEPHWSDSAELWIAAMCAATVTFASPGQRSLQTVATLLTNPELMRRAIDGLCGSDAWDGLLARLGQQLTHFQEKELASTLTTTNRHLRFLSTPAVVESTSTSSFDPSELSQGQMTIYLILPAEHRQAQASLLRLWITSLLRAVVRGGLHE
jgi:type IV secretion system protein VirD4